MKKAFLVKEGKPFLLNLLYHSSNLKTKKLSTDWLHPNYYK